MCEKAIENEPYSLKFVPDQYKAQEMFERAVEKKSWLLENVPDLFMTQKHKIRA